MIKNQVITKVFGRVKKIILLFNHKFKRLEKIITPDTSSFSATLLTHTIDKKSNFLIFSTIWNLGRIQFPKADMVFEKATKLKLKKIKSAQQLCSFLKQIFRSTNC